MTSALFKTADLCDAHDAELHYAEPIFQDYGGRKGFYGVISTLKIFEDNGLVKAALSEPGEGRVLVVDGGGSLRRALLGDQLAKRAVDNGWAGLVIYGCIRDSADVAEFDLGVKALATHPRKTEKRSEGQRDIEVQFAGVRFVPGHYIYADEDGVVTAARNLIDEKIG